MFGRRLRESQLRVHRLPLERYRSWMFESKEKLYQAEGYDGTAALTDGTANAGSTAPALVHFTCAAGQYKDHLARALGLYRNVLGAYCSPRPTLELDVLAWRGTADTLRARAAFLAAAAAATGRALVPPKWAWLEREGAEELQLPWIRVFDLNAPPLSNVEVKWSRAKPGVRDRALRVHEGGSVFCLAPPATMASAGPEGLEPREALPSSLVLQGLPLFLLFP